MFEAMGKVESFAMAYAPVATALFEYPEQP
jgi:hypothetical protein